LTEFKTLPDGAIENRMIVMQEVNRSGAFLLGYAKRGLA